MIAIRAATDMSLVRELFREYQVAADAPACFASFDAELAHLPDPYVAILVAWLDTQPAACVALKPLDLAWGEVKRLYVRPAYRGMGLAQQLMAQVMLAARERGYLRLRLDTLQTMSGAIALYPRLGFVPIPRYNDNSDPGALFFELKLT